MKQPKNSTHRALLVFSALFLFLPCKPLAAQGPGVFDFFFARKDTPSDPLFAGLSLTGFSGIWGFRASGALNFNNGDNGSQNDPNSYRCDRYQCRYYGASYDYGYGPGYYGPAYYGYYGPGYYRPYYRRHYYAPGVGIGIGGFGLSLGAW